MAKKSKQYTREFQENAVRRAGLPGQSVTKVAVELGIPPWKLRSWVKSANDKLEKGSELDELLRLQKELKQAKEDIEILKKAAAYFAKTLP
jgi:transposase